MTRQMPPLTAEEEYVIKKKGTERPFTGQYWDYNKEGEYLCRQCGEVLFDSDQKFASECGWPSFDDARPGAVKELPDADGRRTEIVCAACGGHLGHVFRGEGLTDKNTRFCVNSLSMAFEPEPAKAATTAVFAGGCFWGVEDAFLKVPGVIDVVSGYTGGQVENPSYQDVCTGKTGHAEAVQITYDSSIVSYEQLARLFFEIHDPTELNRQGPDIGTQYRSAVFYLDDGQKAVAEKLISELKSNGWPAVTEVVPFQHFYPAEDYHQRYFEKHGRGGCHLRVERFKK